MGSQLRMEENLPPGFRFHPTDEELITYYLLRKVSDVSFTSKVVAVVDLNKSEPWDLPGTFTVLHHHLSLLHTRFLYIFFFFLIWFGYFISCKSLYMFFHLRIFEGLQLIEFLSKSMIFYKLK